VLNPSSSDTPVFLFLYLILISRAYKPGLQNVFWHFTNSFIRAKLYQDQQPTQFIPYKHWFAFSPHRTVNPGLPWPFQYPDDQRKYLYRCFPSVSRIASALYPIHKKLLTTS